MRKVLVLAAAVAALAGTARAADPPADLREANKDDLRCALAMTVIMRQDENLRQSATVGLYYFVGKLEARDPAIDLAQAMRREASAMQNSQWQREFQRCGAAVQLKTKALEEVREAFQARGAGRR